MNDDKKLSSIKELREITGLSMAKFGQLYSIPYRTLQNWELDEGNPNHRDCPIYVFKLLKRAVIEDFGGAYTEK